MADKRVRKAVVTAAGFGTRLLPQTKAMPKEMMPVVDKPIIQHIVEQLVEAGIEDIIIVTGYHKRPIEDHFDQISADLRENLLQSGKDQLLKSITDISTLANFAYVRQHKGPYGSARPLMNVAHLVGDEPFIYTFADDIIEAKPSHFKQIIELYQKHEAIVLPAIRVNQDEDFERYGMIKTANYKDAIRVDSIVEKPGRQSSPSDLASVGGYLLTPQVFDYIEPGLSLLEKGDEFVLAKYILAPMLEDGAKIYACELNNAKYYDTGSKLGYLKTVTEFAMLHEDLKDDYTSYLRQLLR